MTEWYSTVYKAFMYASCIAFIIGFFTSEETSLGAYLAGYSTLILAIMMILIILFKNTLKLNSNGSTIQIITSILVTSGPFILMLGIIGFVLYLLINYKNRIIDGEVSPGYNSFSNVMVILLMLQLYIVITNISTENFEKTGKISRVMSSIVYLIGVLSLICSIILYITLKYYSTDGFTVN
jgi:lysylphosphatidylglycerol synthetase-like protein (DUF2156 family)